MAIAQTLERRLHSKLVPSLHDLKLPKMRAVAYTTYVVSGLADVGSTVANSLLSGSIAESNPIALTAMNTFGVIPGILACFAVETASVFSITRIMPAKLKLLPSGLGIYLHAVGVVTQIDGMLGIHALPDRLENLVHSNAALYNGACQVAVDVANISYHAIGSLIKLF